MLPVLAFIPLVYAAVPAAPAPPKVTVEVEEPIYTVGNYNNGSGELWCYGSTCITRVGQDVFVSGLELVDGAKPYNNVRWVLWRRGANGWETVQRDDGRTREPCPLVSFPGPDARLFISGNPTLTPITADGGPARPEVIQFSTDPASMLGREVPAWEDTPRFDQHSYRGFAADGPNRELLLLNILAHNAQYWSFRDSTGKWSARGKIVFPWGSEYEVPESKRLCYPTVALRNRAAHVFAVSDIVEPVKAWRAYKKEITGQDWDYEFRQLYYSWTPDITKQPFSEWIQIASREKTAGHASNLDVYVAPNGDAHLLWTETTVDSRLRDKFFPGVQVQQLFKYGVVRHGHLIVRRTLFAGGEKASSESVGWGRFHVTPDGRLFVVYYVGGSNAEGKGVSEDRIMQVFPDGSHGTPIRIPLQTPFSNFMTATPRGGVSPSEYLDLYSQSGSQMRYARVRVE